MRNIYIVHEYGSKFDHRKYVGYSDTYFYGSSIFVHMEDHAMSNCDTYRIVLKNTSQILPYTGFSHVLIFNTYKLNV